MSLYYQDEHVTLYHGDCREAPRPTAGMTVVTDPPYGDTSLSWDTWPEGWTRILEDVTNVWCFGSMRMFLAHGHEFTAAGMKYGQEVIWEKHNGSGFASDRFKRVHEIAMHYYRGAWADIHQEVPRIPGGNGSKSVRKRGNTPHTGTIGDTGYVDDGLRIMRSVIPVRSTHGRALHPTEKPVGILQPLIQYSTPPGGTVYDPFAGSGSTLEAARNLGRSAVGVELDERYCEIIATRLSQSILALDSLG